MILKQHGAQFDRYRPIDKPAFVDQGRWAVFTAFHYEARPVREIAACFGLSSSRVRQILRLVESQLALPREARSDSITLNSPIESLQLSVRARNTLHKRGCSAIQDILDLDLSGSIPGLGQSTRTETLAALQKFGFEHRSVERTGSEWVRIARGLERLNDRIEVALSSAKKEIAQMQTLLRKKIGESS